MLLNTPIVIIAPHGSRIPENVTRVARAVEFFSAGPSCSSCRLRQLGIDKGDTDSLHAATLRALQAAGLEPTH